MGNQMQAGKPSRYVTSHLGQLSLPSFRGKQIEYQPVWLGSRQGVLTCVGRQATLCDPIWQVTLGVRWSSINSYTLPLPLLRPDTLTQLTHKCLIGNTDSMQPATKLD